MDFIVASCEEIYECGECGERFDLETICCCIDTPKCYLVHGKADNQFVEAIMDYMPEVGNIVASIEPQWTKQLSKWEIIEKLRQYSTSLTNVVFPCVSSYFNSLSCAVILCIFGRTPVSVPRSASHFIWKIVELMSKLESVTGNMVKINENGVNCIYLESNIAKDSNVSAAIYFTDCNLKIAVPSTKTEEKTHFEHYSVSQMEEFEENVVNLHYELANCTPRIERHMLQNAVQKTRFYEIEAICQALCRICQVLPNISVIDASIQILSSFRDCGIDNII